MKYLYGLILLLCWQMPVLAATPMAALSDNQRISSQILGYDLQYRVLAPLFIKSAEAVKIIFITDGQNYLEHAKFDQVIASMITQQHISPVIAVFVDSRDPHDLSVDRRNHQFMCNANYARFYRDELIPELEKRYNLHHSADSRMIMGLSFGALNAGCFGILLPETFGYLAMQSPASDKHVKILAKVYQEAPQSAVKMFMTIGTRNDNTRAGRAFHRQLVKQGYEISYHEVPYGHNWDNWRSTLDLLLRWFSPYQSIPEV
ncbi:MAG TPA: alpha/beta hydrolase-fold protein [Rheinheimera sp.]|uniref:alpha/beta hydrolase n=1 Tax=Rheinheimera sp. TaxID=1869214 RepID=UPI002F9350D3